jgi:hypothetical protein
MKFRFDGTIIHADSEESAGWDWDLWGSMQIISCQIPHSWWVRRIRQRGYGRPAVWEVSDREFEGSVSAGDVVDYATSHRPAYPLHAPRYRSVERIG